MKSNYKFFSSVILTAFFSLVICGQENVGTLQVRVSLDHDNWTYKTGEQVKYTFAATLNNSNVSGLDMDIACGAEAMPPIIKKQIKTGATPFKLDIEGMKVPGFFRCIATVKTETKMYRGLATAGFEPEKIKPIVADPLDFDKFWADAITQVSKIPLEPKLELLPSYSTSKVDVYHVSFQNIGTGISPISRIYGILAIPKPKTNGEKFPALLNVPGAGVRPYKGNIEMAERGIITLQIGIHGIPVVLDQGVYDDLRAGALNRYMTYNADDRDAYYYKRVYLGCIRANDLLTSLPQFNGKDLAVIGGSQGGALSIMTAALDRRVKYLAASYPALGDMIAYSAGRAGGWPHQFKDPSDRDPNKVKTAEYYDTINFAKRLKVAGIYSWGFNDEVVPVTSSFAVYNVITAPKQLLLGLEMGHSNSPEQSDKINNWLEKYLKEGK